MTYNLKSFTKFIDEYNNANIDATKAKVDKAKEKEDTADSKSLAAEIEAKMNQKRIKYEKRKDAMQNMKKTASDKQSKKAAGNSLKGIRAKWKTDKEKFKAAIQRNR